MRSMIFLMSRYRELDILVPWGLKDNTHLAHMRGISKPCASTGLRDMAQSGSAHGWGP